MRKNFLHLQLEDLGIDKKRIFVGAFVFLSFSVAFYFLAQYFQLLLIETLGRKFQVPWNVTEETAIATNRFLAMISVVFGLSESLRYVFFVPRKIRLKKNVRLNAIEADQRYLHYGFISFFVRLSFFSIIFSAVCGYNYKIFPLGFYQDYRELFYLVPLVLYLNSWINIIRLFKKRAIEWMVITSVVVFVSGYILHLSGVERTRECRERSFTFNPILVSGIETPVSFSKEYHFRKSLLIGPVIALKDDSLEFYLDSNPIGADSLLRYLQSKIETIDEIERSLVKLKVATDKQLKMSDYNKLKDVVKHTEINKIALVVRSVDSELESWEEVNGYVIDKFRPFVSNLPPLPLTVSLLDLSNEDVCAIDVHTHKKGMKIGSRVIPRNKLIPNFKKMILENSNCLFRMHTREDLSVQDYVWVRSALSAASKELKQAHVKYYYPEKVEESWDRDLKWELYTLYGYRLYVVQPEDYEPLFPKKSELN